MRGENLGFRTRGMRFGALTCAFDGFSRCPLHGIDWAIIGLGGLGMYIEDPEGCHRLPVLSLRCSVGTGLLSFVSLYMGRDQVVI